MRLPRSSHDGIFFAVTYAVIFSLISGVHSACYYPNGNEAKDAFPCSNSPGAMCCPFQWQCMDNGLCYDPNADIMGRYSCSDRSWDSPGCPGFCTYRDTAAGNEAILACEDGRYCCDKNRQSGDCCKDSGFEFIDLPLGVVFATVNSNGRPGVPTTAPGPSLPFSDGPEPTPTPSSSDDDAPTPTPSTIFITSVFSEESSNSDRPGSPSTVVLTSVFTPTSAANTEAPVGGDEPRKSNVGVIVGCAVGVPAGLVLAGLVGFLLWRRRKRAEEEQANTVMDNDHGAGTAFWMSSGVTKPSIDSTGQDLNEKITPVSTSAAQSSTPFGSHGNPVEIDGTERPLSHISELAGSGFARPLSNASELAGDDYIRPRSEVEGSPGSPGLSNHPVPVVAGASNQSPRAGGPGRYYSWSGATNGSAPATPVGGTDNQSPVSSISSLDDLRLRGAHAAHFGTVSSLEPVQEHGVYTGGHAHSASESTPGGRYIPYRPPQAPR